MVWGVGYGSRTGEGGTGQRLKEWVGGTGQKLGVMVHFRTGGMGLSWADSLSPRR